MKNWNKTILFCGCFGLTLSSFASDTNFCYPLSPDEDNPVLSQELDSDAYSASYEEESADSIYNLSRKISAHGEKIFVFSPRLKKWAIYDSQGERIAYGPANGGADYCPDKGGPCRTPGGTYRIHTKKGADCVSSVFPLGIGGAPMPFCMFFRGGYAIHGSPQISNVNGSHGCIRVTTTAARWLHQNFLNHGTKVVILSY